MLQNPLKSLCDNSVSFPTFILRSRPNDGVCDGLYSAAAIQSTQPGVQNRRVVQKREEREGPFVQIRLWQGNGTLKAELLNKELMHCSFFMEKIIVLVLFSNKSTVL